jgi:hypothetical protein
MVAQSNGQVGRDRIHTERILFGAFPPPEAILRRGIETADAVVYRPYRAASLKGELLDCLKGSATLAEFLRLPGAERVGYNTFALIEGTGGGRRVRSTYTEHDVYGTFRGDYGEVSLSVPQVRAAVAKDPALNAYVTPGPLRWEFARSAAEPRQKDAGCRLRVVNPEARRGEWAVVELTAGRDRPGLLYRPPLTRPQTDGGDPLVRFRVRRGASMNTIRSLPPSLLQRVNSTSKPISQRTSRSIFSSSRHSIWSSMAGSQATRWANWRQKFATRAK